MIFQFEDTTGGAYDVKGIKVSSVELFDDLDLFSLDDKVSTRKKHKDAVDVNGLEEMEIEEMI